METDDDAMKIFEGKLGTVPPFCIIGSSEFSYESDTFGKPKIRFTRYGLCG